MRYYPLSVIAQSPLTPPEFAWELSQVYRTAYLSPDAFRACSYVARDTAPLNTPLVIIESVNAPMRRAYTDFPDFEDWLRLERGGFVMTDDFFGLMIDALH